MAKELKPLSEAAQKALDIIQGADEPLTLADINAQSDITIVSGHLTALVRRGHVTSEDKTVEVVVKKKVKAYSVLE